jgi:hypothetical protein
LPKTLSRSCGREHPSIRRPKQTVAERIDEIKKAIEAFDAKLKKRLAKPVVGPQGAITFAGWVEDRAGVTDACAYRRIMATGSALARAEIARAEQLAGRGVDRRVLTQGVHSHDGGATWGTHGRTR